MARGLIEVAAEIRPLASFLLYIIPQPSYFSLLFTTSRPELIAAKLPHGFNVLFYTFHSKLSN